MEWAQLERTVRRPDEAMTLGTPAIGTIIRDEGLAKAHVLARAATSGQPRTTGN